LRLTCSQRFAISALIATLCATGLSAPANAQTRPQDWSLTRLYSVGGESDTAILQRVQSLQQLRDRRLLIADAGARSVIVVDSLGRVRPPLGRMGSGPAEYRAPQALAVIGDTVAVLDPGNGRIGLFSSSGAWQGSWVVQPITGGTNVRLYRVPGADFYAYGVRKIGAKLATTFIHFDPRGPRDTLAPDPEPTSPDFGAMCNGSDRGIRFFSTTFQSRHVRIPGPRGTLLDAETSAYRIVHHTLAGDTVATFAGPATRVPISNAEWDSAGAEFAAYLKQDKDAKCSTRSLSRPSSKPAIRAFWWDDAGRLWVERYATSGFAFDVFSQRGALLASMPAPERVSDVEPSVVGNRIALLGATADGAHVVHVYRFGLILQFHI